VVAEPVADSPIPMAVTSIVGSPMTEVDEDLEPVFHEPITNHEDEQQEPPVQDVSHNEPPRRSQRAEGRLSLMTTRFMLAKKFKWREIPPLLKKP
jgi:hypothetical protein